MYSITDLPARFQKKIFINPNTKCWEWVACTRPASSPRYLPYGRVGWKGKNLSAHRVVYMLLVADLIEGMEIDHLCRNTICVNPQHLEQVNALTNKLRAVHKKIKESGHAGVGWFPKVKKWRAYITRQNKRVHLGLFENVEDAITARRKAEVQYALSLQ